MFYDRKVKYLDYCENGERVKGCGVAKLQMRDKCLNVEIMVSGLEAEEACSRPIKVMCESGSFDLGTIHIENSKGSFRYQCGDVSQLRGALDYSQWTGLWIELDGAREIKCSWKAEPERAIGREVLQSSELRAEAQASENQRTVETGEKTENRPASENPRTPRQAPLADDKWSQLWKIYPHVKPFEDEREYLSIRPADFVIFSADSYKAVNNSFLLHGFYNYHHLILGQMKKDGEDIYYVGVPGNYFEREKQVAIMFGFESFECQEEPAQAGDFGYYMIRTQL